MPVRPIPKGFHALTSYLAIEGAAFGAEVRMGGNH